MIRQVGTFPGRAVDWDYTETDSNGNPVLTIEYKCKLPDGAEDVGFQKLYFSEKAFNRTLGQLRELGVADTKPESLGALRKRGGKLDAHEVDVTFKLETFQPDASDPERV